MLLLQGISSQTRYEDNGLHDAIKLLGGKLIIMKSKKIDKRGKNVFYNI